MAYDFGAGVYFANIKHQFSGNNINYTMGPAQGSSKDGS